MSITSETPAAAAPRPTINHYGEHIDALVKIPTRDNGEPLVDMFAVCPTLTWAAKSPRWDFPRTGLIRQSVAQMLKKSQELLPDGLRLQIVGGFRSFAIQQQMYAMARSEMAALHPDWDDEFLTDQLNVFSAPPILETPPPHTTGGAVDLSVIDGNGERLDMISPFEMGWDSAPTDLPGLSPQARRNRDLLISVLLEGGLTNYPGEWWHWSYGEPGWALRTGNPVALYGAVPEADIPAWSPPG